MAQALRTYAIQSVLTMTTTMMMVAMLMMALMEIFKDECVDAGSLG